MKLSLRIGPPSGLVQTRPWLLFGALPIWEAIANVSDLVRNLETLARELDTNHAEQLRTIVDLERSLGRGRGLGMER